MSIEDKLIRRQVFVQRFAGSQAREAQAMLDALYSRLSIKLLRSTSDFESGRISLLMADINNMLGREFDELGKFISDGSVQYATDELAFSQKALQLSTNVVLSVPDIAQIEQAVLMTGMDVAVGAGTLTLNEAIAAFNEKKIFDIGMAINDGILSGETTQQMTSRIMKETLTKHRSQVEALVRTATNQASSMARAQMFKQNASILKGEEWVATLDSRTSLICAGRDGRIYPVGKGAYPPAHWNCRSVRVPVIKDEFAIGSQSTQRPEVAADGIGTTTSATKFDGWLRRQPADFQNEYFSQFPDGLEKAKLFRNGGLSIDRFRDETGRNFTLEQLRALEPTAFGDANIPLP